MFAVALVLGVFALRIFAADQLIEENEPATRSAQGSSRTRSTTHCRRRPTHNPRSTPSCEALGTSGSHPFPARRRLPLMPPRPAPDDGARAGSSTSSASPNRRVVPVTIETTASATSLLAGYSAEFSKNGWDFWPSRLSATALMLLTGLIAYFTAGAALRPLRELGRRSHPYAAGRLRAPDPGCRARRKSAEAAMRPTSLPAR